jgi:hypothetical protein
MVTQIIAWVGLLSVLLIALHWALSAARRRGRRLPSPLHHLLDLLDGMGHWFDADRRAEARRRQRVQRAQVQREAIARASGPVPLDPPVTWEGNVARPQFGGKTRPHNLH